MQPLDKDILFSIFEKGDEEIYQEHSITNVLDNPYVLIGMVVQGVQNYQLLDLMCTRHYGNKYQRVKDSIKNKYFCKLFRHLEKVELNTIKDKFTVGSSYDLQEASLSLTDLLYYFEKEEEYEKCAIIKPFLDLIQKDIYGIC